MNRFITELKSTLTKVDSIIKSYVKIKDQKNQVWPITTIKSETCFEQPLKKLLMFIDSASQTKIMNNKIETDVLIIVKVRDTQDDILAAAGPCIVKNSRTIVGMMELNKKNMPLRSSRPAFEQYSDVMTLLHEMFHALAFSPGIHNSLSKDLKDIKKPGNRLNDSSRFNYLMKMTSIPGQDPLLDNEHWNQAYIPNDLMIPIERIDTVLSIFTLEYIEYVSKYDEIKVFRQNLQYNYIATEIKDFSNFFGYKCARDIPKSVYSNFCSNDERLKIQKACDSTYMFKAKCGNKLLANNCYEKVSDKRENCVAKFDKSSGVSMTNFETRGQNSRCFETPDGSDSYCLQVTLENNLIKIMLPNDNFVSCHVSNSKKPVSFSYDVGGKKKDFELLCPDVKRFTDIFNKMNCPNMCFGNGFCSNGQCKCFEGYDQFSNCEKKSVSSTAETSFIA